MHSSWKSIAGVKAFRTRGGSPIFVVYCIFINKFFFLFAGRGPMLYYPFSLTPLCASMTTNYLNINFKLWTSNSNFWNHLALYFLCYNNFFRFLFSFQLRRPKFWRKLIRKGFLLIVKVPKNFFWGKINFWETFENNFLINCLHCSILLSLIFSTSFFPFNNYLKVKLQLWKSQYFTVLHLFEDA